MTEGPDAAGVLIAGLFGTGKSTIAEEIATRLEHAELAYAAIDLDWLSWFGTARIDPHRDTSVFLANLAAVVTNYLAAGVRYFVLAGSIGDPGELYELRAAVPFPVTVIELEAPWEVVERRLRSSPTAGRLDDLEEVRRQLETGGTATAADAVVDADRSVADVATAALAVLGWMDGASAS